MPTVNPWALAKRTETGYQVMARCRNVAEAFRLVEVLKKRGGVFSVWFEVCSLSWYQEELNRLQDQKRQLYAGKVGIEELGAIASLNTQQRKTLMAAATWCKARGLQLGALTVKDRLYLVPFQQVIGENDEVAA